MFNPTGQVFRWGAELGLKVERKAKEKLVPGRGYRDGALQRSIGHSTVPAGESLNVYVRAENYKAIWIHEGTDPHPIGPKNPEGALHFYWIKAGRDFKGRPGQAINHPGNKANPFLKDAMVEVMIEERLGV